MNIERIKVVRDDIAKSSTFDMTRGVHTCGSPGCVAGHAFVRAEPGEYVGVMAGAAAWLGLDAGQAGELFVPRGAWDWLADRFEPRFITAEHAAYTLDHLIETGEVDYVAGHRRMVLSQLEGSDRGG